jgi:hypothetical protein
MTTPDALNDSMTKNLYPVRLRFFAHRFSRLVFKSCAILDIGPYAALLILHIVHTEDAARYRGPVRFWNSQLLETLGLSSERALRDARDKAVKFGWLHYERESNRKVARYWVTIPAGVDVFDDSPIEPNGFGNMCNIPVDNAGPNDLNAGVFMDTETPDSRTEKRRIRDHTSNPVPSRLSPNPLPEEIQDGPSAKLMAVITRWNAWADEGLVSHHAKTLRVSAAVLKAWGKSQQNAELRETLARLDEIEAAIRGSPFCREGWFRLEKLLAGSNKDGELILLKLIDGGYADQANRCRSNLHNTIFKTPLGEQDVL